MNLIEKYGVDAQGLVQRYGGIERCREIVEKAPEGALNWWPYRECYAKETENHPFFCPFVGVEDRTSTSIFKNGSWSTYRSQGFPNLVSLESMRLAIADHDRTDHCSDIKNHISPTTKVIEK